jgi:hypothetical protein
MSSSTQLCYLAAIVVAVGLVVWGLFDILKPKQKGESDASVTQRQLRGFGYLVLAQIVISIGVAVCPEVTGAVGRFLG